MGDYFVEMDVAFQPIFNDYINLTVNDEYDFIIDYYYVEND